MATPNAIKNECQRVDDRGRIKEFSTLIETFCSCISERTLFTFIFQKVQFLLINKRKKEEKSNFSPGFRPYYVLSKVII